MPRGSPELTKAREDEIIRACEDLYSSKSFNEITMTEISQATSFSRSSIYNYFQTKEEIFLALLKREYEGWAACLEEMRILHEVMSVDEFADRLAQSLADRNQMLKLLSMNHFDMEKNSSPAHLARFKVAFGATMSAVRGCLVQYFPDMTEEDRQNFIYAFFPFVYGVYPYTAVTEKQFGAMAQAGVEYPKISVYDITRSCVLQLLHGR